MRKLKLKDICGYFPYGLHGLNCDDMIVKLDYTNIGNFMRSLELYDPEDDEDEWVSAYLYKPILRPISDLYKTITHNGKKIVPIVELAKIAFTEYKFWKYGGYFGHCENCAYEGRKDIIFEYKSDYFSAHYFLDGIITKVKHQYQLYDYLHELKIDFRRLIDSGLAIDCNTLDNNPYK